MSCACTDPTQVTGAKPGKVSAWVAVVDGDCLRDESGRCRVFLDAASASAVADGATPEPVRA